MGSKQKDIAGRRFGRLTALEPTKQRRNGYVVWLCRCDCGREAFVPSRFLRNGWSTDCGCGMGSEPGEDLTGRRFGKLVAMGPQGNSPAGGRRKWLCQCDCGQVVAVEAKQLISGYRKSCGCLRHPSLKNWVGRRFGNLTVVAYGGKQDGKHYWRCQCTCGRETVVCQSNLQIGHTKSCGCLSDPTATRHFVEGTCIESIKSRKVAASNRSGVRGVYRNERTGRWAAQITFQGKTRYLGSFDSLSEAAQVRAEAEKIFDEFLERHEGTKQRVDTVAMSCGIAGGLNG